MNMEMLTVLDENGIPTGEVLSRKEIHRQGLWHEAILVAIINEQNKVLMQQRSQEKDKFPGLWDLTVAGHVPAAEIPIDTVFSEMMEEMGLVLPKRTKLSELKHIKTFRDQRIIADDFIENQFYNLYVAHANVDPAKIIMQEDEVQQLKLLSLFEVQKFAKEGLCHPRTQWIDFVKTHASRSAFR